MRITKLLCVVGVAWVCVVWVSAGDGRDALSCVVLSSNGTYLVVAIKKSSVHTAGRQSERALREAPVWVCVCG